MQKDIWIRQVALEKLQGSVAVVGSPGLRSIGRLAVDRLIFETKAELLAELYSTHLPAAYQTSPSYASHPSLPGMGGAFVESGSVDLPKIQFYFSKVPSVVFARGYHANFEGQYTVAQRTVDFLIDSGVKRILVVAGFGSKEKKVCCAATSKELLDELQAKFGVGLGYKGPFMGFSGLVFGLAKVRGIEAMCLFAGTEPREDDLEFPDTEGADLAVEAVGKILGLAPKKN